MSVNDLIYVRDLCSGQPKPVPEPGDGGGRGPGHRARQRNAPRRSRADALVYSEEN